MPRARMDWEDLKPAGRKNRLQSDLTKANLEGRLEDAARLARRLHDEFNVGKGRPQKYHTPEERRRARLGYSSQYRERVKQDPAKMQSQRAQQAIYRARMSYRGKIALAMSQNLIPFAPGALEKYMQDYKLFVQLMNKEPPPGMFPEYDSFERDDGDIFDTEPGFDESPPTSSVQLPTVLSPDELLQQQRASYDDL